MDKQREMFDAWAKNAHPSHSSGYFEWRDEFGDYALDEVQFAFDAWQAAIAAQSKAQQGWKLVPVEPTEDMLWALYGFLVGQLCELEYERYRNMLSVAPEPTK